MNREATRQDSATRLHRRAVIGAILLIGFVAVPVLSVLTWLNWSIVFRGSDWNRFELSHLQMPEFVTVLLAVLALIVLFRMFAKWLLEAIDARLEARRSPRT